LFVADVELPFVETLVGPPPRSRSERDAYAARNRQAQPANGAEKFVA
jgi:hypothetical protein